MSILILFFKALDKNFSYTPYLVINLFTHELRYRGLTSVSHTFF